MRKLAASIKFVIFVSLVLSYFFWTGLIYPIYMISPFRGRKLFCKTMSLHSRIFFFITNTTVTVLDQSREITPVQGMVISNHLSYLDMLVINAVIPSSFVTSIEIKNTPVLGHLAIMSGALFVERRDKSNLGREVESISRALSEGTTVCIFPEATSTNGEQLLRFKRPLFKAAYDANVKIFPICLNYKSINGTRLDQNNRDFICWYGDMSFVPHLWNFLQLKSAQVELTILPPYMADAEPTQSAEIGHRRISEVFIPFNQI